MLGILSAGYSDGSGVVRGPGRGLAGAVGLPLGGALAAISAVSAGLAAATGVSAIAVVHRATPEPGAPCCTSSSGRAAPTACLPLLDRQLYLQHD